jgi:phage gp36-like protein
MYATASKLLSRFGATELAQLADRSIPSLVSAEMLTTAAAGGDMSGYTPEEQAATAAALDVINQALADAAGEISPYLEGRYTLPLTVIPDVLVRVACDLARYYLYDDRAPDQIKDRRDNAVGLLRLIADRKASLGISEAGQPAASSPGSVQAISAAPVFTRETLRDY